MRQSSLAFIIGISLAAGTWHLEAADEALLREISRVERELARAASPDERGPAEARLRRAADAVRRGRKYLALHELSTAWRIQAAYTFSSARAERTRTLDDFKREWAAAGEPLSPRSAADLPLVVAALATSAESIGPATYRASFSYAEDVGLREGLYYLGDARGAAEFGAFCRTLKFEPPGSRPPLRSITSEMDRFEGDLVKLYDKADANARRSFIGISVGMKIARERNEAGDHAAALLQYLLARYQLGQVVTKEPGADAAERIAAFSKALTGADHSIAQFFFEIAATSFEGHDAGRQATAIADFVLPEYVEIVKK